MMRKENERDLDSKKLVPAKLRMTSTNPGSPSAKNWGLSSEQEALGPWERSRKITRSNRLANKTFFLRKQKRDWPVVLPFFKYTQVVSKCKAPLPCSAKRTWGSRQKNRKHGDRVEVGLKTVLWRIKYGPWHSERRHAEKYAWNTGRNGQLGYQHHQFG